MEIKPDSSHQRHTYTSSDAMYFLGIFMQKLPQVIQMMTNPILDKKFSERLNLAVTAVNGCKICTYGHTKTMLEEGIALDEIRSILECDFGCIPTQEAAGMMFAQHFADTKCHPSREACKRLIKEYGLTRAQAIFDTCQMITMGNMAGHLLDRIESFTKIRFGLEKLVGRDPYEKEESL